MPGTCKALCHLERKVELLNLEEESYNHIISWLLCLIDFGNAIVSIFINIPI